MKTLRCEKSGGFVTLQVICPWFPPSNRPFMCAVLLRGERKSLEGGQGVGGFLNFLPFSQLVEVLLILLSVSEVSPPVLPLLPQS